MTERRYTCAVFVLWLLMTLLTLGRSGENPVSAAGKEDWTGRTARSPEILLLGAASQKLLLFRPTSPSLFHLWADEIWKCSFLQEAELAAGARQQFWQRAGSQGGWKPEPAWQGRAACGGKLLGGAKRERSHLDSRWNPEDVQQEWRRAFLHPRLPRGLQLTSEWCPLPDWWQILTHLAWPSCRDTELYKATTDARLGPKSFRVGLSCCV